jgi:DNA-directed RNA polymerase subunit M/transcription elongation factor TFIIS
MLPGTQHLKFIDATVSTSYVCEVHGHVMPEGISDGASTALACPHCLEEMEHGEAREKPEIVSVGELVAKIEGFAPSKRMALLPASSIQGQFECPWCKEKFHKYWDLNEHQEICPAIVMCKVEKCDHEVVGKCNVCGHTYCGDHMSERGVCDFCEEFASPS